MEKIKGGLIGMHTGIPRCLLVIGAVSFLFFSSGEKSVTAGEYTGEKIIYNIAPVGRAEYNDLGEVDVDGQRLNCVTFRTQVMGFDDTETIYSDPQTHLPMRVDRDVKKWMGRERLVEWYDQKSFELAIDKFKNNKKVKHYAFKSDAPIQNAILLPFYLRTVDDLQIGWEIKVNIPEEFTIRLASFEEVKVPAGKFMAYHFTSTPDKFEIWISKDDLRLPIKIKGLGSMDYAMLMKKHSLPYSDQDR
jgi:hypothetical protein